jgi:rhodanese-related sulfurtransferase
MLEFWVDPASPYHRPELLAKPRLIFYCGSGWRSALAAQAIQAMGHPGVAHVEGGFTALKAANAAVVPRRPHKPAA